MKNTVRYFLGFVMLMSLSYPMVAIAEDTTLTCVVKTYTRDGFGSQESMESWFPRFTTHVLSSGKSHLVELNWDGDATERGGRIKIVYPAESSDGETLDVVYTFIKKNNIFTVLLDAGAEFKSNAGTQGSCTIE